MENSLSNWQDSLDDKLVNRLTRPLRQPGMMDMGMGERIINRCDRFLNRLPLLNQQMQRWGNTNTLSSESPKIVYAQPVSLAKEQGIENFQPTVSHDQPAVNIIQRKADSAQSLPVKKVNNTPVGNITDLSSSNFSESSFTIPVVSPQTITEESKTGDMLLQAKLIDSPASSYVDAIAPINHTAISSSDIPVVSPQAIADKPKTGDMPLQAKLADSPASSSYVDAIAPINHTAISSSAIPVVSPQAIAENLPKTGDMPLQPKLADSPASSSYVDGVKMPLIQESISISEQPLPIIQAKQQNSSISSSSLPVVNHLHTLGFPKQTQPDTYSKTIRSIQHKKLASHILSKNLIIVTAQPNLTENKTSQNQPASILNTQPVNIDNLQINQSNHNKNISPLPLVSITSANNPSLKPQSSPLPLAKTTPSSKSISQQSYLSQQSQFKTDSSSPPKTFVHPISPTETSVSPNITQANIDVDSIASQVERKLMRRLVIESERRGKNQWR
ncbi:hypothetical protein [Calothrix sp. PCC 7507]|uniref:hypothetical protein n=1 Tax=Calothrix sp. PCC 7507 TaxID=99598 RepID=UPI00029ECD65|nr:hypothetical protein [Calothrix sp. PCC 7507]AFY33611.1 hypothetical protein Cal7507_3204 [Calothrix sp. PCC 7507]